MRPLLPALAVSLLLTTLHAAPASAQGVMDRLSRSLGRSAPGKAVRNLSADAKMLDAESVPLDAAALPTVPVGSLLLGAAGADLKPGTAIRLRLYLHNPGDAEATVPRPDPSLFVLVDDRGRRLELLDGPAVAEEHVDGGMLKVPGLERIELLLLFANPNVDARTATLKVGSVGRISGIPLEVGAAPASGSSAASPSADPWRSGGGGAPKAPAVARPAAPPPPAPAPAPAPAPQTPPAPSPAPAPGRPTTSSAP